MGRHRSHVGLERGDVALGQVGHYPGHHHHAAAMAHRGSTGAHAGGDAQTAAHDQGVGQHAGLVGRQGHPDDHAPAGRGEEGQPPADGRHGGQPTPDRGCDAKDEPGLGNAQPGQPATVEDDDLRSGSGTETHRWSLQAHGLDGVGQGDHDGNRQGGGGPEPDPDGHQGRRSQGHARYVAQAVPPPVEQRGKGPEGGCHQRQSHALIGAASEEERGLGGAGAGDDSEHVRRDHLAGTGQLGPPHGGAGHDQGTRGCDGGGEGGRTPCQAGRTGRHYDGGAMGGLGAGGGEQRRPDHQRDRGGGERPGGRRDGRDRGGHCKHSERVPEGPRHDGPERWSDREAAQRGHEPSQGHEGDAQPGTGITIPRAVRANEHQDHPGAGQDRERGEGAGHGLGRGHNPPGRQGPEGIVADEQGGQLDGQEHRGQSLVGEGDAGVGRHPGGDGSRRQADAGDGGQPKVSATGRLPAQHHDHHRAGDHPQQGLGAPGQAQLDEDASAHRGAGVPQCPRGQEPGQGSQAGDDRPGHGGPGRGCGPRRR